MKILVTGGTGFVGRALVRRLADLREIDVICAVRHQADLTGVGTHPVLIGDIDSQTDWTAVLRKTVAVIHAAARVHVMRDNSPDPLAKFRQVNVEGTINLARQAADAGVKRFIFISSVKVNGEETPPGSPFTEDQEPAPSDPYGISKLEAECALREIAESSEMAVVIIRPPLIYGPGVGANFYRLIKTVHQGIPLPLGAVENRRSLIGLDNLVDLICVCVEHPEAGNQIFLAADGEDLATPELIRRIGIALEKRPRLLRFPVPLLELAGGVTGRRAAIQRLCSSLQVDISKARTQLGWSPPVSLDEGLRKTARYFLESVR
jgi:UDP-glucose 4-epimerase